MRTSSTGVPFWSVMVPLRPRKSFWAKAAGTERGAVAMPQAEKRVEAVRSAIEERSVKRARGRILDMRFSRVDVCGSPGYWWGVYIGAGGWGMTNQIHR